jgi:nitrogen fixation protein FixH
MATPEDITPPDGLDVGDTRTFKATITDDVDVPITISLDDVTLTFRDPAGEEEDFTGAAQLSNPSTGVVTLRQKLTLPGRWYWRCNWDDGANSETTEVMFKVTRSRI